MVYTVVLNPHSPQKFGMSINRCGNMPKTESRVEGFPNTMQSSDTHMHASMWKNYVFCMNDLLSWLPSSLMVYTGDGTSASEFQGFGILPGIS